MIHSVLYDIQKRSDKVGENITLSRVVIAKNRMMRLKNITLSVCVYYFQYVWFIVMTHKGDKRIWYVRRIVSVNVTNFQADGVYVGEGVQCDSRYGTTTVPNYTA